MKDDENAAATPKLKGPVNWEIPEGDDRERLVCGDCGFIHYDNPRVIVGAVCTWQDKVLLCKRAIEPRKGYWTIPAGFLELNETMAEGAAREVREESGAHITITGLLGIFEIPRISQIYTVYKADMVSAHLDPGFESEEAGLFDWADIPWDEIAFSSVRWSLETYRDGKQSPMFEVATT